MEAWTANELMAQNIQRLNYNTTIDNITLYTYGTY